MFIIPFIMLLAGCSQMAPFASTIDDIATQQALNITIDKNLISKDQTIEISVKITPTPIAK